MRQIPIASFALAGGLLTSAQSTTRTDPGPRVQIQDARAAVEEQRGETQASYVDGQVLAALELAAPAQAEFVLRGTVPLPPRTFPLAGGASPFAVRDPLGVEAPAQVEVVSRYARASDGADVVEVLARVARPPGALPGARLLYEIVWAPHAPAPLDLDPAVQELLAAPESLTLRAHDVFGNEYRADLLRDLREHTDELRTLRDGAVALQVRAHEPLLPVEPVPGGHGTLPHLLGVHAFVTVWDEAPLVSLDLRVHNGADGLDRQDPLDDALGEVYFRELELTAPAGWRVVAALEDPMQGAPYPLPGARAAWPIVRPLADGRLHVIGQQGQFHRRLVLARTGHEEAARELVEEAWLGFCARGVNAQHQELFSWWNGRTARYFPQNEPLPDLWHLDPRAERDALAAHAALYRDVLRTGADAPWPVVVPDLGWAHPWGLQTGYAVGGDEINLYDGVRTAWCASREGYRHFQLVHRMMTERHPTTLFDGDGEAFTLEDWVVPGPTGPYLPVYLWTTPVLWIADPFGFGRSPAFQREAVAALGLVPDYEHALLAFEAIDRAHLIRYTRSPKVLAWLGNDALAKDDLRLQAELQRVGYQMLPQNFNGDHIVTGMLADHLAAQANPGQGLAMNRGEGWAIDTVTAAYALADPEWREKTWRWFHDLADVIALGIADCTGIIIADPSLNQLGGGYRLRQSISAAILQNALWGVRSTAFGERDPEARDALSSDLRRDLVASISPLVWNEGEHAPWFYVAVGPYDASLPVYCGDWPDHGFLQVDAFQVWSSFAYGFELTGDPQFLQRAAETLGGPLSTPALEAGGYGSVENRAALMALVQELYE